jgi:3-hydroxyisobutyrate dehydrogenase-like beta-hydroxyacid dehydrogenase
MDGNPIPLTASNAPLNGATLGWIGAGGRMGAALVSRLLTTGHEVHVFNRTRSKIDPLVSRGAVPVDAPSELGDRTIVFVTVGGDEDLHEVLDGATGILSGEQAPSIVVDLTTVSADASARVRERLAERGTALLAAPVSGNAKVIEAGLMSVVVSGPEEAFAEAAPFLDVLARRTVYVGEGEKARLVKICHNLYLGVVIQGLIEVAVLAEKGGIARHDLLEFINTSVMGSVFSSYKSPALVNLDFSPTFTLELLHKDVSLAADAAQQLGVPLPLGSVVKQVVESGLAQGHAAEDFAVLIEVAANDAGLELAPEDVEVVTRLEEHVEALTESAETS